jgi:DNA (cytosine-5)-methyltransferase 1
LRSDGNGEKENEGRKQQSQPEFGKDSGTTADTAEFRCGERSGEYNNTGEREIHQGEQYDRNEIRSIVENGSQYGVTADTGLFGQEIGQQQSVGTDKLCKERPVANTGNQGLQRSQNNGNIGKVRENGNKQFTRFLQPTFDKFPTQPPVCSRNDGLSAGLAGITVSKHRNESIKAYGNAIVPQIAFNIFYAINKYKNFKN